ncbi:MAG: PfaD family polyunsaturated fatty acid/polyketide biosynthesis protein [Planctomycetota bacterium]
MHTAVQAIARPLSHARGGALLGWWTRSAQEPAGSDLDLDAALRDLMQPLFVIEGESGALEARSGGEARLGGGPPPAGARPLRAFVPQCPADRLGDAEFRAAHGLRYAYVTGAMANGIASEELVEAVSRAGMLGFFGSAGLGIERVTAAIDRLQQNLGDQPFGINLIHSPAEPGLESAVVDLLLQRGVRLVEASAFLDLTLPVVRYRVHGTHRDEAGVIVTPNSVMAKVSRVEVAQKFLAPPPAKFLAQLVANGELTGEQAELAAQVPMAQDLTAEADSGGHTDNRPALALLPTMLALRDRLQEEHRYEPAIRVGVAGGIGTPAATAAAFALGAAYVVTGSVNQACIESGSSDNVREMLAAAEQADVTMAPAADMFEMGVQVQVLKRGTMFAMRAARLFELYQAHDSIEALPAAERVRIEKTFFRSSFDDVLARTREYFLERDPAQWELAERDPKHRLALAFRWYLGHTSQWANRGDDSRRVDYQVWCGPAMGAFNEWTRGSFLQNAGERTVATVARNLLFGAAVLTRRHALRAQGISWPNEKPVTPQSAADVKRWVP